MENNCEIALYEPETLGLEVRLETETAWLTQAQIARLFNKTQENISIHFRNIFKEGELDKNSVYKKSLYTAADGKVYKTKYYNLDAIISIGYRVNSPQATKFRIWATKILKEYLLKGYAQNPDFYSQDNRDVISLLEKLTCLVVELNDDVKAMRKNKIVKFKPQTASEECISEPAELITKGLDWNSDKSLWAWKTITTALIECGMSNPNKGECRSAVRQLKKNGTMKKKYVHNGIYKYLLPPKKI